MTTHIPRTRRIELLVNSLLHEQYARKALLGELCDELVGVDGLEDVLQSAASLLDDLSVGEDSRYRLEMNHIAERIQEELARYDPREAAGPGCGKYRFIRGFPPQRGDSGTHQRTG